MMNSIHLLKNPADKSVPPLINYDGVVIERFTTSSWTVQQDYQLKSLVEQTNADDTIDWTRIAELCGKSSQECFARYQNKLSPVLNTSNWTRKEEDRLKELVDTYGPYNWIILSAELGTNRSPIQCLRHYQQNLNSDAVLHTEWTKDEDTLLREGVAKYGVGDWKAISEFVPRRSAAQCLTRWRKSTENRENIVAGPWAEIDERKLFVLAISFRVQCLSQSKHPQEVIEALFNRGEIHEIPEVATQEVEVFHKWTRIAELIPGKSEDQCREKWTNNLDPTISADPFTDEEDVAIKSLVAYFGEGHWTKLAKFLPGRTDAAVRRRWLQLKKKTVSI